MRPVSGPASQRRWEGRDGEDVVSAMARRNLHHLLSRIFLDQSDTTLAACRQVCSAWWKYLRQMFWRDPVVRRQLDERLLERWRAGLCSKVELSVQGHTCKTKCKENFRECHCLEKLQCAMNGNQVTLEFGGTSFLGLKREGEGPGALRVPSQAVSHHFDTPQFQLSLHLKLGLELELSTWLSSPVFIQGKKGKEDKLRVETGDWIVEETEGVPGGLTVRSRTPGQGQVLHKLPPPSLGERLLQLKAAGSLIATNVGGRVRVYNIQALARGSRQPALLYASQSPALLVPVANGGDKQTTDTPTDIATKTG